MKHILQNKRNTIFSLEIVLAFTLCIAIQGCSKEENFVIETEDGYLISSKKVSGDLEFLNLEIPKDREFSEKELGILDKAFQRMQKNIVIKNDTCFLTIHSPEAVNMSASLFSLIEQSIANANIQYEMYELFKGKDVSFTIKNPFEISSPIIRLRASSEIEYYGAYGYTIAYTLSDSEVTTIINALRNANGVASAFAATITGAFPSGIIASALIAAYGYLQDSQFASIQNEYANSGSTSGIVLREYTSTPPGYGVNFTTYGSTIIY